MWLFVCKISVLLRLFVCLFCVIDASLIVDGRSVLKDSSPFVWFAVKKNARH